MAHYGLNASQLADQLNVGRSSISHILSGRNKPSLDFILAMVNNFEEVDLYWLTKGKGSFPSSSHGTGSSGGDNYPSEQVKQQSIQEKPQAPMTDNPSPTNNTRQPVKVIVLYDDGSFSSYEPS